MRVPTFLKEANGAVWLNPARKYARGTMLAPGPGLMPFTVPAKSGNNPGRSSIILLEGAQNAVTEIQGLTGLRGEEVTDVGDRMSCVITDPAYRRELMNRDILVDHVFGDYQFPFVLSESIGLESQQSLSLQLLNNSTSGAGSFSMAAKGNKIESSEETAKLVDDFANQMRVRKTFCCPYWLTSDGAVSIAASAANQRVFFTNVREWTLVLFYAMARIKTTGVAGDTTEGFTATIYDPGTQRILTTQNQPVPRSLCSGTAQKPYVLPWPIIMLPNTQGWIDFNNLVTDAALEIFWTFHGVAVFDGQPIWNQKEIDLSMPVTQDIPGARRGR